MDLENKFDGYEKTVKENNRREIAIGVGLAAFLAITVYGSAYLMGKGDSHEREFYGGQPVQSYIERMLK